MRSAPAALADRQPTQPRMLDYLRRLATTGAAYTASSVLSKVIAVMLLPVYTRALTEADYGAAEVLFVTVVAASIVIRLGVIEALLRFYYLASEQGERVVATGFAALFWATTAGAALALPFAEPISRATLGQSEPELVRIAIGGLWLLTVYEYMVALFRLDERARAYFAFTMANVVTAIPLTVTLIVVLDEGARGLLVGTYAAAIPFVVWLLWSERRRLALVPEWALLRRMLRFGLPTMPAELTLYSLQFIDRIVIARYVGLAEAGLYAVAFKFSQAIQVVVRGFQLAWPPLAYSILDDERARQAYATILTAFVALCAWIVVGLWLEARWILRLLAAPEFFEAHRVVGLLALGAALYGIYLALLVVLGRTGRTEYNLPATAAAMVANIVLNLLLVPPHGIVGAGVALVASYVIVIALMYVFTQRLFPVPWQWGRLAAIALITAAVIAAGELLLPTEGAIGFASRALAWAAFPVLLWFGGVLSREERRRIAELARPTELRRRLEEARLRAAAEPAASGGGTEVLEAELRDEDRGGA